MLLLELFYPYIELCSYGTIYLQCQCSDVLEVTHPLVKGTAATQEIEQVVHQSQGQWFNLWLLQPPRNKVSLGKALNPKSVLVGQLTMLSLFHECVMRGRLFGALSSKAEVKSIYHVLGLRPGLPDPTEHNLFSML